MEDKWIGIKKTIGKNNEFKQEENNLVFINKMKEYLNIKIKDKHESKIGMIRARKVEVTTLTKEAIKRVITRREKKKLKFQGVQYCLVAQYFIIFLIQNGLQYTRKICY